MSDQPKREASEDPNPRPSIRRKTGTSEDPSSQDLPDRQPEPDLDSTLEGSDGRRLAFDPVADRPDRPSPNAIVPDIIITSPNTPSPTLSGVPEGEEGSPGVRRESTGSPSSTTVSEAPEVRGEQPQGGDELPKAKEKLPKGKDGSLEDDSPEEK